MSSRLISPLVLPKVTAVRRSAGTGSGIGRPPMPPLPIRATGRLLFLVATVEQRGRVVARDAIEALCWQPGTALQFREVAGHVVVSASEDATYTITSRGHLYLPLPVRRWCGLDAGARVLLVGDPDHGHLIIHPLPALDHLFRQLHLTLIGGGLS